MLLAGLGLSVIALTGIIYILLSKKSTQHQKTAALAALIIIGIVIIALAIIVIVVGLGNGEEETASYLDLTPGTEQPVAKSNHLPLILFLLILAALFGFVVRLHKRQGNGHQQPLGTNKQAIEKN